MKDYQQRAVDELRELNIKLGGLNDFLNNDNKIMNLPSDEHNRMMLQQEYMTNYRNVLDERIAAF